MKNKIIIAIALFMISASMFSTALKIAPTHADEPSEPTFPRIEKVGLFLR